MDEMISIAIDRAKPGRDGDLERELLARVEPTRAQTGNIAFTPHRLAGNPGAHAVAHLSRPPDRRDTPVLNTAAESAPRGSATDRQESA